MTDKVKKGDLYRGIAIILAALIAGNVVAGMFAGIITNALNADSTDFSGEETQQALQQSDELVRTLAEDSIVLLKKPGGFGRRARPAPDGGRAESQPLRLQRL